MIVGIDEVGRGAWAGPLCVGAVLLGDIQIEGLTDSKKLTAKKREKLTLEIKQKAAGVGLGWVSAKVIDQIGLSAALKLAAKRAVSQIHLSYDQIIIDGTINLLQELFSQSGVKNTKFKDYQNKVITMKRADLLVPSVSAASIVAKVARDSYMKIVAEKFPGYGFGGHVGYGTAAHAAALQQLGPSAIHRMSFAPLKSEMRSASDEMRAKRNRTSYVVSRNSEKTTTAIGNNAEDAVVHYIQKHGYTVIDRNWKTKWCEIDIIASRKGVVHFIEVKYRQNDAQGSGLAYITPKKLRQMKFAAELWLTNKDVPQAVLSAIEVSGEEFRVSEFIEII